MPSKYQGLRIRSRVFYLRLGVPRKYWDLAQCREIGYSLNTSDFKIATKYWEQGLAHLQTFMNVFEDIVMQLNSDNQLILTESDIDKILLYRLDQIQHFLEENATEIASSQKSAVDVILFAQANKEKQIKILMSKYILGYLRYVIEKGKGNITLKHIYDEFQKEEVALGLSGRQVETQSAGLLTKHMLSLDTYATKSVKALKEDRNYFPTNPKVKSLVKTYETIQTTRRINNSLTSTHWEKLFNRFCKYKTNVRGTSKQRLHADKLSLRLDFLLIKKEYIEDITKQDCRKLSEVIYRVPKRWADKLEPGESIYTILTNNPKKALSKTTIQRYLQVFKEFMRYAEREDIISNDFNNSIDIPLRTDAIRREPFDSYELKMIFNPKTFMPVITRRYLARFWVPLIALYQGCRLNEICQLDLDDIVVEKGIFCFNINHDGKDKSTKNEASVRLIPIHPQLEQLGFLEYVRYQQKQKKTKLFSELNQQKRGLYGRAVQSWFARYLDELGLKEPSKVFHSFRHTFETKAVEARIPTEYQNALGGWRDYGIGQRIYGRKKDIRILYEELSKIEYPLQKEMAQLEERFKDSFVVKSLR